MNRTLRQVLGENDPDQTNPKREVMRLPTVTYGVNVEDYDGNVNDADYKWRNALAEQLNRLSGLVGELQHDGRADLANDLQQLITRAAEFEDIEIVQ